MGAETYLERAASLLDKLADQHRNYGQAGSPVTGYQYGRLIARMAAGLALSGAGGRKQEVDAFGIELLQEIRRFIPQDAGGKPTDASNGLIEIGRAYLAGEEAL